MSNFGAVEPGILVPVFRCAAPGLQHAQRTPYEIYIRAVAKLECVESEVTIPSFPHAFSGNPGEFRTGPPIKAFGGDDLR